jgi:uncharacterized protein YcgL (UPF0745 family)
MLASFVVCYHSGQIKKLAIMLCHIYRSNRKFDTYLYLVDKDDSVPRSSASVSI